MVSKTSSYSLLSIVRYSSLKFMREEMRRIALFSSGERIFFRRRDSVNLTILFRFYLHFVVRFQFDIDGCNECRTS